MSVSASVRCVMCLCCSLVVLTFAFFSYDESSLLVLLSDGLTRLLQLRAAIRIHRDAEEEGGGRERGRGSGVRCGGVAMCLVSAVTQQRE